MARGAKPATRRQRAVGKGGRPRIEGVARTRSGRMTKAEERRRAAAKRRDVRSVALEARKRQLGLADRDAGHHDAPRQDLPDERSHGAVARLTRGRDRQTLVAQRLGEQAGVRGRAGPVDPLEHDEKPLDHGRRR